MSSRSVIAPIVLIVVGTVFLLGNLGLLEHPMQLLQRWWPLVLIAVGVSMLLRRLR